jgi:hypothetical protein
MRRKILTAMVLAALTACGSQQVGTSDPRGIADGAALGPERVVAASAEIADIEARMRASYELWAGDLYAHQASAFLHAYGLNGQQAECLDDRGVPHDGWESAIQGASVTEYYVTNVLLAPPERYWSYEHLVNAQAGRLHVLRERSEAARYRRAHDECGGLPAMHSDDELSALVSPQVVGRLTEQWSASLAGATAQFGDESVVSDCFAESDLGGRFAGVAPGAGGEGWVALLEEELPPPELIPVGGEAPSSAWTQYLDDEKLVILALWACHSGNYTDILAGMPAVIADFEEHHASEIAEAVSGWEAIKEKALALGWSPDRPLGTPRGQYL